MAYRIVERESGVAISDKKHVLMQEARDEQAENALLTDIIFDPHPVSREQAGYRPLSVEKKTQKRGFSIGEVFTRHFGRHHESDLR